MIDQAIVAALAPIRGDLTVQREMIMTYGETWDTLTAQVEVCKTSDHGFVDVTALKADIIGLRRDMDELNADMPAVSEIRLSIVTKDAATADDDGESDTAEIDEEELGAHDKTIF
ncbi:uncharacterized protein LOC125833039 [Solanum verrucosum]|uniref:uncharacterized protein LOC125833039 n=1 Tax=Solanum verrucosum TaxID=315347 RepID=UPI0020D1AE1C|nr:uncharacterized protein LOC125833039 [Solanum verrucosum]